MTTRERKNNFFGCVCNVCGVWLLNLFQVFFDIDVRIYEGAKEGLCVLMLLGADDVGQIVSIECVGRAV